MKNLRYIVVALMAMIAADALAWTAEVNKAILMLTEENLSKSAGKQAAELLGAPLSDYKFENGGKSKTRLNAEGKSVTTDEKDAVVQLEKAIALLGNKSAAVEARKAALQTAIEKSVDIHCPANILIDTKLEDDFTFGRDNGRPKNSRWFKVKERKWRDMWHSQYHKDHGAFSAEMYIYDWHIATKGMAKQYKKAAIAPRVWAELTGARVLESLKIFYPGAVVNMLEITKQEPVNDAAMYDAAFRLAALLNSTLK